MNIEYNLNVNDVIDYNLFYLSYSPQIKRRMKIRGIIAFSSSGFFLLLAILMIIIGSFSLAIGSFIAMFFMIVYYFISNRMILRRIKKEVIRRYGHGKNDVVGKHMFSITAERIKDITEMGEQMTRWDVIENVVTTDQYLFIIIRASSNAYIIPRRIFKIDSGFTKFAETARTYQQAATEFKV